MVSYHLELNSFWVRGEKVFDRKEARESGVSDCGEVFDLSLHCALLIPTRPNKGGQNVSIDGEKEETCS